MRISGSSQLPPLDKEHIATHRLRRAVASDVGLVFREKGAAYQVRLRPEANGTGWVIRGNHRFGYGFGPYQERLGRAMSESAFTGKPILQQVEKTSGKIATVFLYVAGLSLAIIIISLVYSAITRYIFRLPWVWSLDLPMYLQVVVISLALANAQRLRAHIRIEFLTERFRGWAKSLSEVISSLGIVFVCAMLVWGASEEMISAVRIGEKTPSTGIHYSAVFLVIVLGVALLGLQALLEIMLSAARKSSDGRHS